MTKESIKTSSLQTLNYASKILINGYNLKSIEGVCIAKKNNTKFQIHSSNYRITRFNLK